MVLPRQNMCLWSLFFGSFNGRFTFTLLYTYFSVNICSKRTFSLNISTVDEDFVRLCLTPFLKLPYFVNVTQRNLCFIKRKLVSPSSLYFNAFLRFQVKKNCKKFLFFFFGDSNNVQPKKLTCFAVHTPFLCCMSKGHSLRSTNTILYSLSFS